MKVMYWCVAMSGKELVDSSRSGHKSIYHINCEFLVHTGQELCRNCAKHWKSLRSFRDECQRTHPSSHTPYLALTAPEKDKCLHHLHLEIQLDRFQEKIDRASHNVHVVVDETLDNGIWSMASESAVIVNHQYPEEHIFGSNNRKLHH